MKTTAQTFEVDGQLVNYTTAAFIGRPETDLFNSTKVEAEGPIVSGVLQAEKVKFKANFEFEANAATVNAGTGTLTLEDLAGITVLFFL